MKSNIVSFYEKSDEHSRMANTPLEYLRSKEIISRYLPERGAILDVGGATGAYSFWLAGLGHEVTLVDFTPKHIEQALSIQAESTAKLKAAMVGDARALPFTDNSFDVVLVMGPLYHLLEHADRVAALVEALRVTKEGGVVLCTGISRYASMADGFFGGLVADPEFVEIMNRDIPTGVHHDTSQAQIYFTDAYLHLPEEILSEMGEAGFQKPELFAVTSFGWNIPEVEKKIQDAAYRELLLRTIRQVEKRPELMGISSHYMGVGVKA